MLYYEFEPIPADQTETWAPSGRGRVYFNSAEGLRLYLPVEKGGHAGSTALENLTEHHGLIFFAVDVEAGQQYFKKSTASDEGESATKTVFISDVVRRLKDQVDWLTTRLDEVQAPAALVEALPGSLGFNAAMKNPDQPAADLQTLFDLQRAVKEFGERCDGVLKPVIESQLPPFPDRTA